MCQSWITKIIKKLSKSVFKATDFKDTSLNHCYCCKYLQQKRCFTILLFLFCYITFTIVYLDYNQTVLYNGILENIKIILKTNQSSLKNELDNSSHLWLIPNTYLIFPPRNKGRDIIEKYIFAQSETTINPIQINPDEKIRIPSRRSTLPKCDEKFVAENVTVHEKINDRIDLDNLYPMVSQGGYYTPPDCIAIHKIAILVPYRNRQKILRLFLYNIHPFLMRQKLEYRIFVIEQSGKERFNRGRLFNAGVLEIEKMGDWQCVVFHDVDLLPTNNRIRYSCPLLPTHISSSVLQKENIYDTPIYSFGGVTVMTIEQIKLANGYSNLYWGWGGEDDDMKIRLNISGLGMARYKENIGIYTSLPHKKQIVNRLRFQILQEAELRHERDGLNKANFTRLCVSLHHLYTNILIDVDTPDLVIMMRGYRLQNLDPFHYSVVKSVKAVSDRTKAKP